MRMGKMPENVLKRSVLRQIRTKSAEVAIGAGIGEDCAVFSYSGEGCLVTCMQEAEIATGPGVPAGTTLAHLIQRCANNLAAGGAELKAVLIGLILPEAMEEPELKRLMAEAEEKCASLSAQIAGGQTRTSGAVTAPIAVVTGYGRYFRETERQPEPVRPGGRQEGMPPGQSTADGIGRAAQGQRAADGTGRTAQGQSTADSTGRAAQGQGAADNTAGTAQGQRAADGIGKAAPGQDVVLSKWIGLEGTAILARRNREKLLARYPSHLVEEAAGFDRYLSVVTEAAAAVKSGVCAMHDVSEGGIFGALRELAEKAGVGLTIDVKKLPLRQETVEVCECCRANPYELLSGGCLLMTAEDGPGLAAALKAEGIPATVVGKVTAGRERILVNGGEVRYLDRAGQDAVYGSPSAD